MRLGLILILTVSFGGAMAQAADPVDRCASEKVREAGRYAHCRARMRAKAIRNGTAADYSKCTVRLLSKWAKAEARAVARGADCSNQSAASDFAAFVAEHGDRLAAAVEGGSLPDLGVKVLETGQVVSYGPGSDGAIQAGAALSYTDNRDGTITDNNTGLMWEKKDDSGGLHDKDNRYSWTEDVNGIDTSGTAFTVFLDQLNDVAGGGADCFAGHCDWRMPNLKELMSIVDLEQQNPTIHPAFHQSTTCAGCTDVTVPECSCSAINYWTSTTSDFDIFAWAISFSQGGGQIPIEKYVLFLSVRAVRGGV